jgi:CheY-like chemotaxis protein
MQEADPQISLSSEKITITEASPILPPTCSPCEKEQEETKAAIKALVLCFCGQEMCSTLKRHLMGLPLEVRQVTTVAECIEKAESYPVWTIVLESDEKGFEALTQLKNEPSVYHIPIILSSAEIAQHGFHVGPVEYLEKPIEDKKVFDALLRVTKVRKGDILVIDDDMIIRKVYSRMLSKAGYTPYVAGSGIEALEVLSKHTAFQAIILDLMMPDMDGFQVLERIQQDQIWRRIPVVVVTAKTLSQAERSLIHNGTQLLLEKGKFSVETLSQQVESVTQSVTLAGTRSILVVDDNEMNLNLVSGVFESAGYTVYTSQSAHEGIEVAQKVLPDTILMDLAMPDMDGFEATQILKQRPETSDITVIVCSAFTTREYKDKASQVGCEGYITKPIEPNRLVEQVTRLVLTSKIKKKLAQQNIPNNDYS